MKKPLFKNLSRREREIMNVVYKLGEASVSEVVDRIPDEPGYDTIRVTLGILTRKGFLKRRKQDRRYIYKPIVPREKASRTAVSNLLETFFAGSPSKAVLAMLDESSAKISKKELDEIAAWVERERKK
jgi:predicted transcriptional regulator